MSDVIIQLKIMPESPDSDLDVVKKECTEILSKFGDVGKIEIRPVAFGLKALIIYLITAEEKGGTDKMEEELSKVQQVNSVAVEDVRRTLEV